MSEQQHQRLVEKRKREIADLQTQTLQTINRSGLNEKQKKALKGTYDELIKAAAEAARKVKEERDLVTESKLGGPPRK